MKINNLEYLKSISEKYNVLDLTKNVLDNISFQTWSGSSSHKLHHYGDSQLLQHTREVVELCELNAKAVNLPEEEVKLLIISAIFHDYGKIYDYEKIDLIWKSTEHKYKIHHIFRSASYWERVANENSFPNEQTQEVTHTILSHHQLSEWGSPVQPQTKIAWLLHLCDSISARVNEL